MMLLKLFCLAFVAIQYVTSNELDVLMPNVSPKVKDTYLCYKYKLDSEKPVFITEFIPKSKMQIAHHMLLFGCREPGRQEDVWNCGEMHANGESDNQYELGSVCSGKQDIIYAWAMDAPKLVLPKDVAFKIGGNSGINYIVLQVHYANVDGFQKGDTDQSGVTLVGQDEPTSNTAGTFLLATEGSMLPTSTEYFETACELRQNIKLHPFAFRTHSHKLGVVTSGYRVRFDKNTGEQSWIEIGRRSPQLPQMFYPVTNQVPIETGDVIAARCTMKNTRDHVVSIGSTGEDEMCNFYMMYYVEGDRPLDNNYCVSPGPPSWYFDQFKTRDGKRFNMLAIPASASELPPSDETPSMNHGNMDHSNMNHMDSNNDHVQSDKVNNVASDELEIELNSLEEAKLHKLLKRYWKYL